MADAKDKCTKIWCVAALILLALTLQRALTNVTNPVNHDCGMYLETGCFLLQGKIPYVDFIDINPPLIFYLSVIPAYLSQISGLSLFHSFSLVIWLVVFFSWLLVASLFRFYPQLEVRLIGPILFALAAFSFSVGEWGEFGQRQHLAALGIAPFVHCRFLRFIKDDDGKAKTFTPLAVVTGLLCGLLVSLVPQYFIIPLAVESYFLYKKGTLKKLINAETIALVAVVAIYFCFLLSLQETAKQALWHRWLPLVGQGYSAYNGDWLAFTTYPFIIGCFPLILMAVLIAINHRCSLTIPLIVWCVAAYLAALIQLKGWYNHYIPMQAGAFLLATVQVDCLVFDNSKKFTRFLAPIIATISLAVCALPSSLIRQSFPFPQGQLQALKKETVPGDNVMVLSTAVHDIYPVILQAQCINSSRFLFLFPVEMLRWLEKNGSSQRARDKAHDDLNQVLAEIAEDVNRTRPKVILIPCGANAEEQKNSMMVFLQKQGLIEKLRCNYIEVGQCVGRKSTFAIFRRVQPHQNLPVSNSSS